MGELKMKLNIKKITTKNLVVLVLVMMMMGILGVVAKIIGGDAMKMTNVSKAQAQCWSYTSVGGGCACGDAGGCGTGEGASSGCTSGSSDAGCAGEGAGEGGGQ
jgi:hypothetical protein